MHAPSLLQAAFSAPGQRGSSLQAHRVRDRIPEVRNGREPGRMCGGEPAWPFRVSFVEENSMARHGGPPTEMPSRQIPQDKLSLNSRWIVQKTLAELACRRCPDAQLKDLFSDRVHRSLLTCQTWEGDSATWLLDHMDWTAAPSCQTVTAVAP